MNNMIGCNPGRSCQTATASSQAVAYGMGGGLLQRVNRDTMQFATKLCHIVYADGASRDIAKMPKSDAAKTVGTLLEGVTSVSSSNGDSSGDRQRSLKLQSDAHSQTGGCHCHCQRQVACQYRCAHSAWGTCNRHLAVHCLQSLPGILAVKRIGGVPTVFPAESGDVSGGENLLQTVYDMRPVQVRPCATNTAHSQQLLASGPCKHVSPELGCPPVVSSAASIQRSPHDNPHDVCLAPRLRGKHADSIMMLC